jgi:hypothetical protein
MRLLLFFIVGICATIGLWNCEVCGISREPMLGVSVYNSNGSAMIFTKVKVLGAKKEFINNDYRQGLPLNLNANSTTYIFEQATRTDTLTVFYEKVIEDKSTKCGYVLDIKRPTSGQAFKTTFKNLSINYIPYYSLRGQEGGIYVSVKL